VPEIIEVEAARQLIEERALKREIARVYAPDAWFLKRGLTPAAIEAILPGLRFVAARRRGKLLLVDTDRGGPVVGMHLGMSGRVLVDGAAAGDPLIYASNRDVDGWRRFGVEFADGGSMHLRDPRRLGAVELEPDEARLGPDALTLTLGQLEAVVKRSKAPIKAVLMNQARIAGLGNLLTDEALWRAGIDPARVASTLDEGQRRVLHRAVRATLRTTTRRGGSHTGELPRDADARCPKDGSPLQRRTVGGRTTYSCPRHQQ
jgi:formamidopyrimidine-DNA glycosylase